MKLKKAIINIIGLAIMVLPLILYYNGVIEFWKVIPPLGVGLVFFFIRVEWVDKIFKKLMDKL